MSQIIVNLKSGFFISLIAMPLCLGIALASACPPIAGVLTAIVGGLVVSLLGGSELSIKGPAAGLIVIVLGAVTDLGGGDLTLGYRRMLAVAVIASLLQITFALFKTARFGRVMPPSVIHGMLAAIGIIILAKQIHVLLGTAPHGKTPLDLILEIPESFMNVNPELAFIGTFTLVLITILPSIPSQIVKAIPPALLALLVVVPLGLYWHLDLDHSYNFLDHEFSVGPAYLVNLPNNFLSSVVFPDFSILSEAIAYKYVLMFALVGSIESVLTVIAVDSLKKNKSDLDRDLLGLGIGNLLCALIGGLPMISEVVRSKANIDSGATSRLSNFFHGAFLLLFVSLLAPLIKEIPLAALAAMLMIVGFRLASPRQFKHSLTMGLDQLALFTVTLVVTVVEDLLIGILAGCALKLTIHLIRGAQLRKLSSVDVINETTDTLIRIVIMGPAIFTNFISLERKVRNALASGTRVEIDFSKATLVDHTTLSCLDDLEQEIGNNKLAITGLNALNRIAEHKLSTHRLA